MFIQDKVKNLPSLPGVYLMLDSSSQIIYIGKAKNLKIRVSSYFQNAKNHSPKIKKLVQHLKDFDYIITDTEFEALLLECQLIKAEKPLYNRMMKNPKSFVYVEIDPEKLKMKLTYTPASHNYFGPFPSKNSFEQALLGIRECYKILCANNTANKTPCLNYTLGLCCGICLGGKAVDQYKQVLKKVVSLLNGDDLSILEEIRLMMDLASEKMDFEKAARYRNYLEAISSLQKKEKVIEFTEKNNMIVAIERLSENSAKFFIINRTRIVYSEIIDIRSNLAPVHHILSTLYSQSFVECNVIKVRKEEIDEAQIIYNYYTGASCKAMIIPNSRLTSKNSKWLESKIESLFKQTFDK